MTDWTVPTLADIYAARSRIADGAVRTPLVPAPVLSELFGQETHLKPEFLQPTGAFKLRGALNMARGLDPDARRHGFTTMSTGNHGRAVAYAARGLGLPAIVCMSSLVPEAKRRAVEMLGAEARVIGRSQDEAAVEAERLVEEEGMVLIPPFDHPAVIAGQGTIGLEIVEDLPGVRQILVPLSGGGLAAGVAIAAKAADPTIRIVGLTTDRGAAMAESLRAGHPVAVEEVPSLADSLGGGIGLDNRLTFRICRELVDEVVLMTEEEIAAGMALAARDLRLILEGAAAIGLAGLLHRPQLRRRGPTAVLLTGNSVDLRDALDAMHDVTTDRLTPSGERDR